MVGGEIRINSRREDFAKITKLGRLIFFWPLRLKGISMLEDRLHAFGFEDKTAPSSAYRRDLEKEFPKHLSLC